MANPHTSKWVAIIDDDARLREALLDSLDEAGFSAQAFPSAEEFLDSGHRHQCSCIIADVRMSGMSGLDLQAKLNAERLRVPFIFITAHSDEQMRMQALRAGAVKFLGKPFDDEVLLDTVRAALER